MQVQAFKFPPIIAISSAKSFALLLLVPLNTICSSICDIPFVSRVSNADPTLTQTPKETVFKYSIGSMTSGIPLESSFTFIILLPHHPSIVPSLSTDQNGRLLIVPYW